MTTVSKHVFSRRILYHIRAIHVHFVVKLLTYHLFFVCLHLWCRLLCRIFCQRVITSSSLQCFKFELFNNQNSQGFSLDPKAMQGRGPRKEITWRHGVILVSNIRPIYWLDQYYTMAPWYSFQKHHFLIFVNTSSSLKTKSFTTTEKKN